MRRGPGRRRARRSGCRASASRPGSARRVGGRRVAPRRSARPLDLRRRATRRSASRVLGRLPSAACVAASCRPLWLAPRGGRRAGVASRRASGPGVGRCGVLGGGGVGRRGRRRRSGRGRRRVGRRRRRRDRAEVGDRVDGRRQARDRDRLDRRAGRDVDRQREVWPVTSVTVTRCSSAEAGTPRTPNRAAAASAMTSFRRLIDGGAESPLAVGARRHGAALVAPEVWPHGTDCDYGSRNSATVKRRRVLRRLRERWRTDKAQVEVEVKVCADRRVRLRYVPAPRRP